MTNADLMKIRRDLEAEADRAQGDLPLHTVGTREALFNAAQAIHIAAARMSDVDTNAKRCLNTIARLNGEWWTKRHLNREG